MGKFITIPLLLLILRGFWFMFLKNTEKNKKVKPYWKNV